MNETLNPNHLIEWRRDYPFKKGDTQEECFLSFGNWIIENIERFVKDEC